MCIYAYICLLSIGFGAGSYATVRSRALAHMLDATLLYVHLHLRACWMLRYCTFTYTCAHAGCYAAVRSIAVAHGTCWTMLDATYCTFICSCGQQHDPAEGTVEPSFV